jgi:hypothetical protein
MARGAGSLAGRHAAGVTAWSVEVFPNPEALLRLAGAGADRRP